MGRNYLHKVALEPLDRYIEEVSIFTGLNKPSLYTDDFRQRLGQSEAATRFREWAARARVDELTRPAALSRQQDLFARRYSYESRSLSMAVSA